MTLHKEAFPTVFFASILWIFFNVGMWRLFHDQIIIHQILLIPSTILLVLVFFFFRVKTNIQPKSEHEILSPAYGKVVAIEKQYEDNYYKDERLLVSIFMSPLDIHCNYYPMAGEIKFAQHYPGRYLVAFHKKSSDLNEHHSIVLENESTSLLVKQIAGFVARRIVPYSKVGDKVNQNDELGFIKFGSRVDIYFPPSTKLNIQVGDKVKATKTVLANLS